VKCNEHWKVFKHDLAADTAHDIHKECLKPLLHTQINNIKVNVIPSLVQMH